MQLNNLVIIPVPFQGYNQLLQKGAQPLSPNKSLIKTGSLKDQISWKKSLSAFKKFKGKKDKQTKSLKSSQVSIPFLQPNSDDCKPDQNFYLVDMDININQLKAENQQVFKNEQTFDYYDPNSAPFFEYGPNNNYINKQQKAQAAQGQQDFPKLTKKCQSLKIKRQSSKRQKSKDQNCQKQNIIKTQRNYISQGYINNQGIFLEDPFIIIRASERRIDYLQQVAKSQSSKKQESKKNKPIKKNSKSYPRQLGNRTYSVQNSCQVKKQDSFQMQKSSSDDYGSDQLPVIEFDFQHLNSCISPVEQKNQNCSQNLQIYEVKDDSQIFRKMKQYQNKSDVLKQYDFVSCEFSQQKNIKEDKTKIQQDK